YDFAPVGYFSLDESGTILEANLTSAAMLGVERSLLVNRSLLRLVSPASRPNFLAFLKMAFTGARDQVCDARLSKANGTAFWASFRATSTISAHGARKWCRVAFADVTSRMEIEEALRE